MKSIAGMGGLGTARELAEMLRQMGRGRDTVLAHITPEEAELLLRRGGAGTTNPMTGLPEFQDADMQPGGFYGESESSDADAQEGGFYGLPAGAYYDPGSNSYTMEEIPSGALYDPATRTYTYTAPTQYDITERTVSEGPTEIRQEVSPFDIGFGPGRFGPEYGPADTAGMSQEQFQRLMGGVQQAPAAAPAAAPQAQGRTGELDRRLVGYGAQGLIGALQAARMRRQTAREAERLRALGAPLREEGENLRQQAMAGTLTPQQARQLEASIARSRQAAVGRGTTTGTQEAMISNVAQRTRADLLQTNLANSLKLLNLANAYDEAAIKAQLAADREADDLLAQIFGNIAQDYAGSASRPRAQQPTQAAAQPMGGQEITRRPDVRG